MPIIWWDARTVVYPYQADVRGFVTNSTSPLFEQVWFSQE